MDSARPLLRHTYFVYKVFMLSMMYIFAITLFADICTNIDDMSVATDDGCIYAGIFVVIFKVMNYEVRRKEIRRLMDEVLKCADDLSAFSSKQIPLKQLWS